MRSAGRVILDNKEGKTVISRRDFIKSAGAGAIALGAMGASGALASCNSGKSITWDMTVDVVVVGSGAAASAAAVTAQSKGASVIMLEKSAAAGGTTYKSGGEIWIPNNFALRAAGVTDARNDCLAFMARANYSTIYNPKDAHFGLPDHEYNNLAAYYDNAAAAIDYMMGIGAIKYAAAGYDYDYWDHAVENKVPAGRGLGPVGGAGSQLIKYFSDYIKAHNINLLTSHRVQEIYLDDKKQVIGVQALDSSGTTSKSVNVKARKAVVFGCGGFTHNKELMRQFQKGPMFGGCAVITNEGDLVYMAQAIGVQLSNMNSAWNAQNPVEAVLKSPSSPNEIWQDPGDSMILVNKYGVRVTDEKRSYNDRTKVHFYWDPVEQEYVNMVMMMVYDQRTADLMAGNYPFPGANDDKSIVISGQTIKELGSNIRARVASLSSQLGIFSIADSFETNLAATITKYNGFANSGIDSDFKRGFYNYDTKWYSIFSPPQKGTKWPANDKPNITMYPFTAEGSYYCILIGAGTLDTNGGPKINEKAQMLDTKENPIPGLYGAGNCIAPLMPNYIAAGATIGNALTSGYIAGMNCVKEPVK
jgi:3-oxosteroid 1-dehydrogenase